MSPSAGSGLCLTEIYRNTAKMVEFLDDYTLSDLPCVKLVIKDIYFPIHILKVVGDVPSLELKASLSTFVTGSTVHLIPILQTIET